MKKFLMGLFLLLSTVSFAGTKVLMKTSLGNLTIELNDAKAPVTTANFLKYVKDGFYNGLIFHRVMSEFVVQGGGHRPDMSEVPTREAIKNEANNGLKNVRGTIAMARTQAPDSATAQFYFNVVDNARLDYKDEANWGYCVFGKILKGGDILDKIRKVKTHTQGDYENVPVKPVLIESVKVI